MAIESSGLLGASNYRFVSGLGAQIAAGGAGTLTITATANERVKVTNLVHATAAGSNLWTLTAGSRTLYASGAIVLGSSSSAVSVGGRFAIWAGTGDKNGAVTFGKGEDVTITNGHGSSVISVTWEIEEEDI